VRISTGPYPTLRTFHPQYSAGARDRGLPFTRDGAVPDHTGFRAPTIGAAAALLGLDSRRDSIDAPRVDNCLILFSMTPTDWPQPVSIRAVWRAAATRLAVARARPRGPDLHSLHGNEHFSARPLTRSSATRGASEDLRPASQQRLRRSTIQSVTMIWRKAIPSGTASAR